MDGMRIFISATTRDLESYRELASETLRERGYVVDDQAIFNLTFQRSARSSRSGSPTATRSSA